jgi:hypothetical protein
MLAYVNKDATSGWMVGDCKGSWLADTVAETLTSTELITNGTFTTDTSGWTNGVVGGSIQAVNGRLRLNSGASGTSNNFAEQDIQTTIGQTYVIHVDMYAGVGGETPYLNVGTASPYLLSPSVSGDYVFTATSTTTRILLRMAGAPTTGDYVEFDNVSVKEAVADRSVAGKWLNVIGTINKTPVATGSQLMGFSNFISTANYLEQPYNAALDFGTGDFSVMGWVRADVTLSDTAILNRGTGAANDGFSIYKQTTTNGGYLRVVAGAGDVVATSQPLAADAWFFFVVMRVNGVMTMWVNGVQCYTGANTANLSCNKPLQIGYRGTFAGTTRGLALIRLSATTPTADQIAQIYRDEVRLFRPGAQCTLDGTSSGITAMSYDDVSDLLHVGTSWGRSAFKGLQRTESAATAVGSVTAVSAYDGGLLVGGASGSITSQPSIALRDELRREYEASRAEMRTPRPYWFTADGVNTDFTLPFGVTPQDVHCQGLVMRDLGHDYITTTDGYRWTVGFVTAPSNNYNIRITGVKNV